MKRFAKTALGLIAALWLAAAARLDAAEARSRNTRVVVWDTSKQLAGDPVGLGPKDDWRVVEPDALPGYAFQGDVVLENDKLQVLCGTRCGPPVVYSKAGVGKVPRRLSLLPLNGKREPCAAITSIKNVENSGHKAVLELCSRSQGGDAVRTSLVLAAGRAFVEVRPGENAEALRACAPSRFAVIPDFFGDDIVLDARRSPHQQLFVPAENIVLNFTGNGDTILMSVWPAGDQEVQAVLRGCSKKGSDPLKPKGSDPFLLQPQSEGPAGRTFEAMEVTFDQKSLFFAVLDSPGIWHSVAMEDPTRTGQDLATGWKKPFEARWRGDFWLPGRTDSWEFESQRRENAVVVPFGQIVWPFWFENGQAMIRNVRPDYLGVALIYPLERRQNTPLSVFTPVDILRETLGTGPCEYILDREGVGTRTPGGSRRLVSTGVCNTTGRIQHFFERGLECKERKIIQDMADDVQAFNITVRQRLQEYHAFARRLTELCREERRRNPAIGPVAERAERLQQRLDVLFAERLAAMKTPQENVALVEQLKELTQAESPENLGKYLSVAAQLRALASAQDTLAALYRCEVRLFRRELGVLAASDRSVAKFAEKLRELTRNALRKKHYTEGA
jgi:hypothetical protein